MDSNLPISQLDPISQGNFTGVGNAFVPWLGPMPTLQRSDPYEKRNTAVWDLPENYKGENLTLRDTVEEIMFTANQTYLTKYIMPLYPTDQVNLQWEKFEANAHLMDLAPYRTATHAVTQKRSIRRAQLVRRSIGAEFEMDFLRTAMGRVVYLAAIRQIINSALETIAAEIIQTLGAGHRYQQQFLRETQIPPETLIKRYMDDDRDRFAIVQKSKNGMAKLDMMITKEMQQYRGTADALLIPEELAIFATIARNEVTDYDKAGPEGPNRVNGLSGLNAKDNQGTLLRVEPMYMVRNTPTFVVHNLQVENVTEAESQQLTRSRQIGEYVKLVDETIDYSSYETEHRSILMYNQEIDDMTKITIEDCIRYCGLWDENGQLKGPGYIEGNVSKRSDLDDDFLTFLSPGPDGKTRRLPCQYIFDIAKEYLSVKKVLGAGQTLLNAVKAKGEDLLPTRAAGGAGLVVPGDLDALINQITNIIGTTDIFGPFTSDKSFRIYAGTNLAPVVALQQEGFIGSRIDEGFNKLLLSQVPASKKSEGEAIISSSISSLEKASQIREKLISYVGENVSGLKLKSTDDVNAWHERSVNEYKKHSKPSAPVGGKIAGYMKRGQDLTGTGYQYVFPESARAATDSIDALLPVHIAKCEAAAGNGAAASAESSRMQSGGDGMGLAGIGQFYRDTFQERRDQNTGLNLNRFQTLRVHLDALDNASASEAVKFMARAWLMTSITRDNFLRLADYNVAVPANFLVVRPHMQYRTRGIIKCKQNGGTGNLFIGNSSFNVGWQTNTKVCQMHYTTHFRAVVTEPRNLYVQPDVFCQEIEGGAGCRFYDAETYAAMDNDHLENSLLCFACPITETIFPQVLDISGRFYTDFGVGTLPRAQFERLHYSTAARYNNLYNFLRSNKNGMDVPQMGPGRNHVNRICWQGHQQNMNPKTKEYSVIITNKGHWRDNATYAGCAPIRNGALEQFKENPTYVYAH